MNYNNYSSSCSSYSECSHNSSYSEDNYKV